LRQIQSLDLLSSFWHIILSENPKTNLEVVFQI
jgi:hypothetical protein